MSKILLSLAKSKLDRGIPIWPPHPRPSYAQELLEGMNPAPISIDIDISRGGVCDICMALLGGVGHWKPLWLESIASH
jgi:hypothetical protein